MAEKLDKKEVKRFIVITKVIPILIAVTHLLNSIISFIGGNDIILNYIGGTSLLPILYLYIASYTFRLCNYYRMFLHYSVAINLLNIYDYYIGINVTDVELLLIVIGLTIITMLIVIYLKFFK